VIHSREGFEETLEVLRDFTDIKIYFHCRGYGAEEVRRVEAMFPQVWFGFTNVISYPSARKTRESLLAVQRAKILLETDAPFLPPQVFRGQTNVPKYVAYVYEKCAELFGMEKQELERQIEENFCALF
jgi:TatD DNase family protein